LRISDGRSVACCELELQTARRASGGHVACVTLNDDMVQIKYGADARSVLEGREVNVVEVVLGFARANEPGGMDVHTKGVDCIWGKALEFDLGFDLRPDDEKFGKCSSTGKTATQYPSELNVGRGGRLHR
jgi:hypothetical protein